MNPKTPEISEALKVLMQELLHRELSYNEVEQVYGLTMGFLNKLNERRI